MAKPIKIEQYGDQMLIHMDDETVALAVPTVGGLWYIDDLHTEPPPEPPPATGGRFSWPFDPRPQSQGGTVTSEYGPRNGRLHAGIDMAGGAASNGNPVPAAGAGRIMVAGSHGGYGNAVVIDHGGGIATLYGHMQWGSLQVSVGQQVAKGKTLGLVGNTGNSYGAHLHFETHTGGYRWNASSMNPRNFMSQHGDGKVLR